MRRSRTLLALLAPLLLTLALTVGPAAGPASAATAGQVSGAALPTSPWGDPPGANDWACVPSAERPTPVILVHGTFGDRRSLLDRLSLSVSRAGYCVYSLDYGDRGRQDIARSAAELGAFVERVREATGAAKVSLVGHSQGGMMPRHYIRFLGGADVVEDLIGLAPSNHGTALTADAANPFNRFLDGFCRACVQQGTGSAFLRELNAGDETPGPVDYTQITTRTDIVVVPHTSGFLTPGPRSTNLTLQDVCPLTPAGHLLIPLATATQSIVLHALDRDGPADPRFRPRCV